MLVGLFWMDEKVILKAERGRGGEKREKKHHVTQWCPKQHCPSYWNGVEEIDQSRDKQNSLGFCFLACWLCLLLYIKLWVCDSNPQTERETPRKCRDGEREVETELENIITLLSEVIRAVNNCWSNISLSSASPTGYDLSSTSMKFGDCISQKSCIFFRCTSENRVDWFFKLQYLLIFRRALYFLFSTHPLKSLVTRLDRSYSVLLKTWVLFVTMNQK